MTTIVRTNDILGGEPRLDETRISVRQVVDLVREHGLDPEDAADELDIDPIDVERCLEYYDTHRREMERYRVREERRIEAVREESRAAEA